MLLEALLALTMLVPRADGVVRSLRAGLPSLTRPAAPVAEPAAPPYFSPVARSVSNWREEAGAGLTPLSLAFVVRHAASDPAFVARCVRLNNYWCIKQARWSGELGGDTEGHTAFATAADGATAAVQLLRRYYRDLGRRSALAIVRRWAPAECGLSRASPVATGLTPRVATALAPRGIGKTLRARYLARHGRGGRPSRVARGGLRVQPWSARARLAGHPGRVSRAAPGQASRLKPVADIATGITNPAPEPAARVQAPARTATAGAADPAALLSTDRLVAESAALPSLVAGLPGGSLLDLRVPPLLCSTDEVRIRNYAARIAASVGLKADDDLRLFDGDGTPTANLAPVLLAMSAVELGSLRAAPALVTGAIGRASSGGSAASRQAMDP